MNTETQKLIDAIEKNNPKAALKAIENDVDLYQLTENGETILSLSIFKMLNQSLDFKSLVKKIIDKTDLDKIAALDNELETKNDILFQFVEEGVLDLVKFMIEEKGFNPLEIRDQYEQTLLHKAVSGSYTLENAEVTKYLIDQGIDVNAKDVDNDTPLVAAVRKTYYQQNTLMARILKDVLNILIENGADVNAKNNSGTTPLMITAISYFDAEYPGDEPSVAVNYIPWLIEKGADINAQDNEGNTALHLAIKENKLPIVKTLCALGADKTIQNNNKETPCTMTKDKKIKEILGC